MQIVGARIDSRDVTPAFRQVLPKLSIAPPRGPIDVPADTAVVLYDDQVDEYMLAYAHLQNVGTTRLKYAINSVAGANQYHEILVGGLADQDGLGASVELSRFSIRKLTVYADAAGAGKVACVLGMDSNRRTAQD